MSGIGSKARVALPEAINATGLAAQRAARERIAARFNQRGTRAFFDRGVVFRKAWPSKPRASLSVGVQGAWPTSATARASAILARHESGGSRSSDATYSLGGKRGLTVGGFYLPATGQRTATRNPPRGLYPRNIGALMRRDASGQTYYAKSSKAKGSVRAGTRSQRAYYVVPRVGIFERLVGLFGSRGSRPLWFFSRRVTTAPRTDFVRVAIIAAGANWLPSARAAVAKALASAR